VGEAKQMVAGRRLDSPKERELDSPGHASAPGPNDSIDVLAQLALNLRSSWNHPADELWAQIDPQLWAMTSNPWVVLQSASPARLRELVASKDFRRRLLAARDRLNEALDGPCWFQDAHPSSPLARVAYFSLEFALAESLPIYSGGLGNVAGDQLKAALWTKTSGRAPWQGPLETTEKNLQSAGDEELWAMRTANRERLVEYARERLAQQDVAAGGPPGDGSSAARLDPAVLTLGFARRFATYKRPNLLLSDPERLLRILTNPERPVQLVVAGKAHPADRFGQQMIAAWSRFIRGSGAWNRVVFIADYDLLLAEYLVRGVDVWVNTPRRPWEASGTSGMKVLVNGGLNLSELDGWWAEAYDPEVGWAIGDGREHGEDPAVDAAEAEALYGLLEREIVPAFYARDARGIPPAWVTKMRASMGRLTPRFSTNRAVREYTDSYYVAAASRYRARAAGGGALGAELFKWRREIERRLPLARFGALRVETERGAHRFSVDVYLGDLDPKAVRVELYADRPSGGEPERHLMTRGRKLEGNGYAYDARIATERPAGHYTPRLVPHHPAASVPLEVSAIRWQR
jgi:glycogen phosphorylase